MKKLLISFCCSAVTLLAGCAVSQNHAPGAATSSPAVTQNVSGNWVFRATPTTGQSLFTQAAASLSQTQGDASITASLVNQSPISEPCLDANALVPLLGTQTGDELGLQSFAINGQYIDLAAKLSDTGTDLNGTYAVHGGCADGAAGTITALQMQPLTGHYVGQTISGAPVTISLQITQLQAGTGDGRFLTSGTAAISGSECFDRGALNFPDGYVLGEAIVAVLHTDDTSGATLTLSGTFPADASTIAVSAAQVTGGLCAGSLGTLTLRRVQP